MSEKWKEYVQQLQEQNKISKSLKKNADLVLKNIFLFNNEYAMEPTQVSYYMKKITWQKTPNGDPEWLYMLKRQEYLNDLLATYYETKEIKYQTKMKSLIFEWIKKNIDYPDTWRTLDTGIRLLNWTNAIANLSEEHKLTEKENELLKQSVQIQAEYLKNNYIEKYDISKWGILITTGILVFASAFPGIIAQDIVEWAEERFRVELELQVDSNGMQWEQSPLYLVEVLRSSLAVVASYQHADLKIPSTVTVKCQKMQCMLENYVKPNGKLLQQGDTDAMHIDSLMSTSALLLDLPLKNKNIKTKYDFMLIELWHKKFETKKIVSRTSNHDFGANSAGNYFWRSSWEKDADFWHIFNENLGSGHGHAELGHIDLVINGKDILVDPGRYTYVDGIERRYLKGATAHNTIMLNDTPFSKPKNSWKYEYVSTPINTQQIKFNDGILTRISYIDTGSNNAVVVRNFLSLPKSHLYVVIDQIFSDTCKGCVRSFWQVNPDFNIQKCSGGYNLEDKFKILSTASEIWSCEGLFSKKYNNLSHLTRIETKTPLNNFVSQYTVISTSNLKEIHKVKPIQSGTQKEANEKLANGLTISFTNGDDYLITTQPTNTIKGRKLYWYNDIETYGTLNVFKLKNGKILDFYQVM